MENEIILSVDRVSMAFGGVRALDNVCLDVGAGEIVGLIGPNGAGKTVLMNCINSVYAPERGTITFEGRGIVGLSPSKIPLLGIARTFQHIELFKELTVLENTMVGFHVKSKNNVLSGGIFWGPAKKEEIKIRRKAEELLDFLELYAYRKQLAGNLSFGIQKLVGLARALAIDPKLLILDEIASGLNREEKEDLARFLLRIMYQKRVSIIWIEHDMQIVTQLADRIVCLNYGRKIAEGTPSEVIQNRQVIEAYLGS
jgi:branched-chain amino acid transport system ATP-binding protein